MGLLDKFKNLFTEEVEEDVVEQVIEPSRLKKEPIVNTEPVRVKKEPMVNLNQTLNIVEPKKEENPVRTESLSPKKEEKFVFPVYFDDKDFEDIEKKDSVKVQRQDSSINHKKEQRVEAHKEAYSKKPSEEKPKKVFKPTPIISPVYGILDKNYYKEDIVISSTSISRSYYDSSKPISIDDVRKKAYGTLEDDLEKTLFTSDSLPSKKSKYNDDEAIFDELDFANAVEEDKRRDLTKDNLKADIESLLDNKEFASEFNYNNSRVEKKLNDSKPNNNIDVSTKQNETENIDNSDDVVIQKDEDNILDSNLTDISIDESENIDNNDDVVIQNDEDNMLDSNLTDISIDDSAAAENISDVDSNDLLDDVVTGSDELIVSTNKSNNPLDDEILLDGAKEQQDNGIDLPLDISSTEIENAYADTSDLNDSDLFNLIDSMYEKEDN